MSVSEAKPKLSKKKIKTLKKLEEILSIYPEEYLEQVTKEAEERWRIIKDTHRKLRNIFNTKPEVIKDKTDFFEAKTRYILNGTRAIFMRNNIQQSTEKRTYYAHFLTLMTWLDPRAIEKHLAKYLPNRVHNDLRLFIYLKYDHPETVSRKLVRASTRSLNNIIGIATYVLGTVSTAVMYEKGVTPKLIDHNYASLLSVTTRMIVENTAAYYLLGSHTGSRVGLYGSLGAGKTTLSFYSIYSALRFLGFTEEEAIRSASAVIINDPYILIRVFSEISESNITDDPVYTPALVADDIASMISKYWFAESKEQRTAVMYLVRALKIAREFIGMFVFPSDVKGSIPGAIRESLDIDIRSETFNYKGRKTTIWIKERNIITLTQPSYARTQKLKTTHVLEDVMATTSPPLYIPPNVYTSLTTYKVRARAIWLRKARASLESLLEKAQTYAELIKTAKELKEDIIESEEELRKIIETLEQN